MSKLYLLNDNVFEIEWAAPVSLTENVTFLAKVLNSDVDQIHEAFKNPDNTRHMITTMSDNEYENVIGAFDGYTRYCGFSVEPDGSILVTLKKNLGV